MHLYIFVRHFLLIIYVFSFLSCSEQIKKNNQYSDEVVLKVLGTIQDGGIPHMGCSKECCVNYFEHTSIRIGVSSIGVSNFKYETNYIVDVTPDVNFQLQALIGNAKPSEKLDGIFLTHAHMGHYAGLLNFGRESLNSNNIPVYLMPKFFDFISNNGPWDQLIKNDNIYLSKIKKDKEFELNKNIKVIKTNRGCKITLHNKGQKIIYFVINLNNRKKDIRKFISALENSILQFLNIYKIKAKSDKKNIGIWVKGKKIAAIGLRVSSWIAFHGCSININNNLKQYLNIVPCGLNNESVTSIYNEKKIRLQNYEKKIADIFIKNIDKI